jgi:hypothetical protein
MAKNRICFEELRELLLELGFAELSQQPEIKEVEP